MELFNMENPVWIRNMVNPKNSKFKRFRTNNLVEII